MNSSDFKKQALDVLKGKWGKAVLLSLGYFLFSVILNFISNRTSEGASVVLSIIVSIIEVPLTFGFIFSFFKFFNGEDVGAFDFLKLGFSNFKKSWFISLNILLKLILPVIVTVVAYIFFMFTLFGTAFTAISQISTTATTGFSFATILSSILVIISSIWLAAESYYYQLAYLVAIENENLTEKEAVEKSKELMTGHRAKLFCLQLSFIGWAILCVFTLGIGYLWLVPYIQLSLVAFYKTLTGVVESKE